MLPTVTAIVPTHNQGALLPEVVLSILSQSRMVSEILIIDHASNDNTADMAARLQAIIETAADPSALPPLYYEHIAERGTAGAVNRTLSKADGDYIWICRAPHLALDHTIETLAAELDAAPETVMVAGSYRRLKSQGRRAKELAPTFWPKLNGGNALRYLLEDRFVPLESMLIRRSALNGVGAFRQDMRRHYAHDMQIRLACSGPVKVIDDPVCLQRVTEDQPHDTPQFADRLSAQDVRTLINPLRERMPLALYEGMFRAEDPKIVRRAALLQRGCVLARATEWSLAVRDFVDASKLAPGFRLSQLEKDICDRALAGHYGYKGALDPEVRSSLRDVANKSAAGGSIARALAGGMARHSATAMASGRLSEVAAIGKFISALRIYTGGHGRGDRPGQVYENVSLPAPTYRVV